MRATRSIVSRLAGVDRAVIGAVALSLVTLATVAIDTGFVTSRLARGGEKVVARFTDTGQLKEGDEVRVDGAKAGRVESIELDPDGRTASVEMTIFDEAMPLHADARASVRWRTVLGGNLVVDLEPGTREAGVLRGPIRPERTRGQVEIENLLDVGRGEPRRGLRTMLAELPEVLSRPLVPAAAFRAVASVSPDLERALSAVRGRGEADLASLVAQAERTVAAVAAPPDGVRGVIEGAAATTEVTAGRAAEIRQTIESAGRIQPDVRMTLARLQRTLSIADPLIARLNAVAPQVAPALRALRPAVAGADALLHDARPLLRDLRPAFTSLAAASRDGAPLLRELAPSATRLAGEILPGLAKPDPITGFRTDDVIGPVIASLNGAAASFDSEGHMFRFPASGGERTHSDVLPCSAYFSDPEAETMLACSSLSESLSQVFDFFSDPTGGSR